MTKHALYRFYNDSGQLLYVGITNDPPRRMRRHSETKSWWHRVRGMTLDWYPDRASVLSAEKRAIRVENPLHNIQSRPEIAGANNLPPEQRLVNTAVELFLREGGDECEVPRLSDDIETAIRNGYSWREICAGASLYGEIPAIGSLALPAYPGQLVEQDIQATADAMHCLSQFIGSEVRRFQAAAESAPEMFNAHPHEITIKAAEIAVDSTEEDGRSRSELLAFLETQNPSGGALEQSRNLWALHGGGDLPADSMEIVELAVSIVLGAPVPTGRDEQRDIGDATRVWRDVWMRCHPEGEPPADFYAQCFDETVRMAKQQGRSQNSILRAAAVAGSRLDPSIRDALPPLDKS